jgi:hypothetical protein
MSASDHNRPLVGTQAREWPVADAQPRPRVPQGVFDDDCRVVARVNPTTSTPKRPRPYRKSGVYALKNAVARRGSRALPPKSTALGRALHEWRDALIDDHGGPDAISTQQSALVDLAVRTKLLVDSVDTYVLAMASPVNRQRRCLHPVVRERQSLVTQLQSILRDLGLERKAKPVPDLASYLTAQSPAGSASP